MRLNRQLPLLLAFLMIAGTGCRRTPHQIAADSITAHFVLKYVRPMSYPVAVLAYKGLDIPPALLASNRVTLVELISQTGDRRTIFEDEKRRPPTDGGMITGVEHASKIGLFYPASLDQPEIEVRVNYYCELGDSVAVHIVVPNPLLLPK